MTEIGELRLGPMYTPDGVVQALQDTENKINEIIRAANTGVGWEDISGKPQYFPVDPELFEGEENNVVSGDGAELPDWADDIDEYITDRLSSWIQPGINVQVTSSDTYDRITVSAVHDHDSRYYTESEMDLLLAGKSAVGHLHDDRYYTETEVDNLFANHLAAVDPHPQYQTQAEGDTRYWQLTIDLATQAELDAHKASGDHDGRYYTEGETDLLLAGKSNVGHTHLTGDVVGGAAGRLLRDTGAAGAWTTLTMPNTIVSGAFFFATAANVLGPLAIGGADQILTSTGAAPQWSTRIAYSALPNSGGTWNAAGGTVSITGNLTTSGSLTSTGSSVTSTAGSIVSRNASNVAYLYADSGSGSTYFNSGFLFRHDGLIRWGIAKSASSAGDLNFNRYNDAGSYLDTPITLSRSSGQVSITKPLAVGTLTVVNASLVLQVESTSGFFRSPIMTTVQRDAVAAPTNGAELYDTTLHKKTIRVNGQWHRVTTYNPSTNHTEFEGVLQGSDMFITSSFEAAGGLFTGSVEFDMGFSLFLGTPGQWAPVANADGTLADITSKFNTLLGYLRTRGDLDT